jgi:hypothetical protein
MVGTFGNSRSGDAVLCDAERGKCLAEFGRSQIVCFHAKVPPGAGSTRRGADHVHRMQPDERSRCEHIMVAVA